MKAIKGIAGKQGFAEGTLEKWLYCMLWWFVKVQGREIFFLFGGAPPFHRMGDFHVSSSLSFILLSDEWEKN